MYLLPLTLFFASLHVTRPGRTFTQFDRMHVFKGGRFKAGINDSRFKYTGEHPLRDEQVKGFEIDIFPVTNLQFADFLKNKKRYLTTAQRKEWSWLFYDFVRHKNAIKGHKNQEAWWVKVEGADWRHPEGPESNITLREDHPVVHISYDDASTYCSWAKKRLPTELEWEFACRGGLRAQQYPWGDSFQHRRMNVWQGLFPLSDAVSDLHHGPSPVKAYPPQSKEGLYDMCGNVWEWTLTNKKKGIEAVKLVKGGSYIDSRDGDFNSAARCASRHWEGREYTAHNLGFRCARSSRADGHDPHMFAKKQEKLKVTEPKRQKVHHKRDSAMYLDPDPDTGKPRIVKTHYVPDHQDL